MAFLSIWRNLAIIATAVALSACASPTDNDLAARHVDDAAAVAAALAPAVGDIRPAHRGDVAMNNWS